MKVLLISGNFLPMSPCGPAYIAGAALKAGHTVKVFDAYIAKDVNSKLKEELLKFGADVVGISIAIVTNDIRDPESEFGTKYFDMRPKIKSIVQTIKQHSNCRIVLGGPGFNYFAKEWLEYLDLDYGIRGEGEYAFPLFLKYMEEGKDTSSVPGCVVKKTGGFHKVSRDWIKDFNDTGLPAYDLFNTAKYQEQNLPFALYTKRGCAFRCVYCPYSSLEGNQYRLKTPVRVVDEIEHILKTTASVNISFCDNSFNCPKNMRKPSVQKSLVANLK